MFISITTDFICSRKIFESNDEVVRRRFLVLSIIVNLSILGFFKYFNFFVSNLEQLLGYFGIHVATRLLHIVLPVGISFYTFQSMSYTLDVYRRQLEPAKGYLDYALFVTFFPQLVAGPIMKARDLIPQIIASRVLSTEKFYEGCYLILWGLYQKIFIADNLSPIVNTIFSYCSPNGLEVILALYAFAVQIYCDFAGYSNIARGLGKCMGFDIMINFNLPYFATNPTDFWKRWHISLSTWLRDYLYIPLGGNRNGVIATYRNLAITMFLGGLWHGASWTFIVWGLYQGMLLIVYKFFSPFLSEIPDFKNLIIKKAWFCIRVIFFFHLMCLGWLFFRAQSMAQAGEFCKGLFFRTFRHDSGLSIMVEKFLFFSWLLILVQIIQFRENDLMAIYKKNVFIKALFYFMVVISILLWGVANAKEFIYFQF